MYIPAIIASHMYTVHLFVLICIADIVSECQIAQYRFFGLIDMNAAIPHT